MARPAGLGHRTNTGHASDRPARQSRADVGDTAARSRLQRPRAAYQPWRRMGLRPDTEVDAWAAYSHGLVAGDSAGASAGCRRIADRRPDLGARLHGNRLSAGGTRACASSTRCSMWSRSRRGRFDWVRTSPWSGSQRGCMISPCLRRTYASRRAGRDRPVRRGVREARARAPRWVCWRRCLH